MGCAMSEKPTGCVKHPDCDKPLWKAESPLEIGLQLYLQ